MTYFNNIANASLSRYTNYNGKICLESRLRRTLNLSLLEDYDEDTGEFDFTFSKEIPTRSFGVISFQYNPVSRELHFDGIPIEELATAANGAHLYRIGIDLYALRGSVSKGTVTTPDGQPITNTNDAIIAIRNKVQEMFNREHNTQRMSGAA